MITLSDFAEKIRESDDIVVFTGAGISTESGIPDFRSPGGIWTRYRPVTFQEYMSSEASRIEAWNASRDSVGAALLVETALHQCCNHSSGPGRPAGPGPVRHVLLAGDAGPRIEKRHDRIDDYQHGPGLHQHVLQRLRIGGQAGHGRWGCVSRCGRGQGRRRKRPSAAAPPGRHGLRYTARCWKPDRGWRCRRATAVRCSGVYRSSAIYDLPKFGLPSKRARLPTASRPGHNQWTTSGSISLARTRGMAHLRNRESGDRSQESDVRRHGQRAMK